MNVDNAPALSFHNKGAVIDSILIGCYHCLTQFTPIEIEEWAEDGSPAATAICPHCGIDAVLPNSPTQDDLIACHERWFNK